MRYFLIFILLGIGSAHAAKFRIYAKDDFSVIISMDGRIEKDDSERFRKIISGYPYEPYKALLLNSGGGQMREAMLIGRLVREIGMITVIPRRMRCMSACSLIFAAGWDNFSDKPYRIKHPNSLLGVHHPRMAKKRKKSGQSVMISMEGYLMFMRAGSKFYQLTAKTSWRSIRYIKNKELKNIGAYIISKKITWPEPPSEIIETYSPKLANSLPEYLKRSSELYIESGSSDEPMPRTTCLHKCKEGWEKAGLRNVHGYDIPLPVRPSAVGRGKGIK